MYIIVSIILIRNETKQKKERENSLKLWMHKLLGTNDKCVCEESSKMEKPFQNNSCEKTHHFRFVHPKNGETVKAK